MKKKFALLLLEEHPMGRAMLELLLSHHFTPTVIIEERSALALRRVKSYLLALNGEAPPTISRMANEYQMPIHLVDNHNSPECADILRQNQIDFIVLGNTRIIQPSIFSIPKSGCINVHPGYLPLVKGSFPVVWAVYLDHPVGCSSHFIDEDIDTGPIIERQLIQVSETDTIQSLVAKSVWVSAQLAVNAVQAYFKGELTASIKNDNTSKCHSWPPDSVVEEARAKLKSGAYRHIVKVL